MGLSNNDVIRQLEQTKSALQDKCDDVDGDQLRCLQRVISILKAEIGSIEAKNLGDRDYNPISDAFKQNTAQGQKFQGDINQVKSAFQTAQSIGAELDKVINIITTFR